MKRYDLVYVLDGGHMLEKSDGEWVKWSDVAAQAAVIERCREYSASETLTPYERWRKCLGRRVLAAANALLERVRDRPEQVAFEGTLEQDIDDHLSGQAPARPLSDSLGEALVQVVEAERTPARSLDVLPNGWERMPGGGLRSAERTDHERAVLEACKALDQHWLERGYTGTTWRRVAQAELARREAEKR